MTCKHVVRDACPDGFHDEAEIPVYFKYMSAGTEKLRWTRVKWHFNTHDDDIVVLQLKESPLPPEVEVAILGRYNEGSPRNFFSFGYRSRDKYIGLPAEGRLVGFCDPIDKWHSKPIMLKSQDIDSGMSGAAVLDEENNLVVGVVVERWKSYDESADRDSSFAVEGTAFQIAPFDLALRTIPLELTPGPQPEIG
jgi:hypothetical protein